MTDLVQRLRDRIHDSHMDTERLIDDAADALEAKDKEIAELEALRNDAVLRMDTYKNVCDQVGDALEEMVGYGNLFRTSRNQRSPYHTAVDALAAWREMK